MLAANTTNTRPTSNTLQATASSLASFPGSLLAPTENKNPPLLFLVGSRGEPGNKATTGLLLCPLRIE